MFAKLLPTMIRMMISPLAMLTWREWLTIMPLTMPSATSVWYPFPLELEDSNVVESNDTRGEVQVMVKEDSRLKPKEWKRRSWRELEGKTHSV